MNARTSLTVYEDVRADQMVEYLESTGWVRIGRSLRSVASWHQPFGEETSQILRLPSDETIPDYGSFVVDAIAVLAKAEAREPEDVLGEIVFRDRLPMNVLARTFEPPSIGSSLILQSCLTDIALAIVEAAVLRSIGERPGRESLAAELADVTRVSVYSTGEPRVSAWVPLTLDREPALLDLYPFAPGEAEIANNLVAVVDELQHAFRVGALRQRSIAPVVALIGAIPKRKNVLEVSIRTGSARWRDLRRDVVLNDLDLDRARSAARQPTLRSVERRVAALPARDEVRVDGAAEVIALERPAITLRLEVRGRQRKLRLRSVSDAQYELALAAHAARLPVRFRGVAVDGRTLTPAGAFELDMGAEPGAP